jgi:D-alanyl-D-alanine dipeptidase
MSDERPRPPYEKIMQTPIIECGEPLVDLLEMSYRIVSLMTEQRMRLQGLEKPLLLARATIAEKLLEVVKDLPPGYGLGIYDAYRPVSVQDAWFAEELKRFQQNHPELTPEQCFIEVSRWLAPTRKEFLERAPPPHSTGGAVDLTIVRIVGHRIEPVDMGGEYCEFSPRSWTHYSGISPEARKNRQLLLELMTAQEFANYAGEWWHFEWGGQLWAVVYGKPFARYGRIDDYSMFLK